MGLLDILTGNSAAASPYAYGGGLLGPQSDPQALAAQYAAAGITPPQIDPFGDPNKPSVAMPGAAAAPATGFGAGAAPFSFAGPGSNVVSPAQIATPAPVPLPQPRPVAADAPAATGAPAQSRPVTAPAAPRAAVTPGASAGDDEGSSTAVAPNASAPSAPASTPFSLGGDLQAAAQSFENSKGLIPRLLNGATALVTGQRSDAAGQAANATARALLAKGASQEDVQAALLNPTLMQSLLSQYYGKDKFSIVQTGENSDGTKQFSVFNTNDGSHKPIAVPIDPNERGGTITGPNGQPIQIPAGVNRKEFVKKVTENAADVATGKQTEAQAKASSFAARMQQAEAAMGKLQGQGLNFWDRAADSLPGGIGNYAQSPQYQQYKQAQSAFITALLRQESGAAISKSEFDRYEKEMFPQPGDSPAVVQQKAQQRASAIQQMQRAAGPGYQAPAAAPSAKGTTSNGIQWSVN